jgi:hypothetical protein
MPWKGRGPQKTTLQALIHRCPLFKGLGFVFLQFPTCTENWKIDSGWWPSDLSRTAAICSLISFAPGFKLVAVTLALAVFSNSDQPLPSPTSKLRSSPPWAQPVAALPVNCAMRHLELDSCAIRHPELDLDRPLAVASWPWPQATLLLNP